MKEALKVLLFLCVVAAAAVAPNDDPIRFTTNGATKDSYKQFIEALRDHFAAGFVHGIRVLPDPETLEDKDRYEVVELSNSETETIQVGIDLTNGHVVAYRAGSGSYFLQDAPSSAYNYLFTDTQVTTLPFNGTYGDLTHWANQTRDEIYLGLDPLKDAISFFSRGVDRNRSRAVYLIMIIEMVSEAARFWNIEARVGLSIQSSSAFQPDDSLLRLEDEWGPLSENVQRSLQGTFPNAVTLYNRNEGVRVSSLSHPALPALALMLFVCKQQQEYSNLSPQPPPMIIRPVVESEDTCDIYEPTVRISGRDWMCVDVFNSTYNDGNRVIVWPCKDRLEDNQLWTLKSDKTIRSKGNNSKCLTAYDPAAGYYVMIYDCQSAVAEATQWEIWENGTIINPRSGLALTSNSSGAAGSVLTVEKNEYKMGQGWRPGNDTTPFVTAISSYMGLCMEAHGLSNMWLDDCDTTNVYQLWAVFSDGSIRPYQNSDNCLTSAEHKQGATIIMMPCSTGWASQRWVFKGDGTIYSLYDDMVMDVKDSDPSLKQIILWPRTGNDNQLWITLLW